MVTYVAGYECDIFVSYATVDDDQKWVTELVRTLKSRLAAWLGRRDSFTIWWDRAELDESRSITQQIRSTLEKTAILLVVLSKGYVESHWCEQERCVFLDAARNGPLADRRTFLVDLGYLEVKDRPAEFRDFKGFEFWEVEDGRRRQVGAPRPVPERDTDFYHKVDDLAKRISDRLEEIREIATSAAQSTDAMPVDSDVSDSPQERPDDRVTVFLAEATGKLDWDRNEVVRYLNQCQTRVVPMDPLPSNLDQCETAIDRYLGESAVFAQLLDQHEGRRVEGTSTRLPRLQFDRACAANVPIVQWRRPNFDFSLVENRNHLGLLDGQTVMEAELEEFKTEIMNLALSCLVKESPSKLAERQSAPWISVYAAADQSDLAEQVRSRIIGLNCSCAPSVDDGNPATIRRDWEANLLSCDGLVLLYGPNSRDWLRARLRMVRKLLHRRETPSRAVAIYDAPVEDKSEVAVSFGRLGFSHHHASSFGQSIDEFARSLRPEETS